MGTVVSNAGDIIAVADPNPSSAMGVLFSGAANDSGGALFNTGRIRATGLGVGAFIDEVSVSNTGKIISDNVGVYMRSDNGSVENAGLIKAVGDGFSGVGVYLENADNMSLVNTGTIKGREQAVFASQEAVIINSGLLTTQGEIAVTTAGATTLSNRGTIEGDVRLSEQADSYLGSGGGVVLGTLMGHGGSDVLVGSKAADRLDGGDDADVLSGRRGVDLLVGGENSDAITGGNGDDTLWGEAKGAAIRAADTFYFLEKRSGADKIKDFDDGMDLIILDLARVEDASFEDLLAAALSENKRGDAVLDLSEIGNMSGKITLVGIDKSVIDAGDFYFIT